jgi:RHS repeat-associated protein
LSGQVRTWTYTWDADDNLVLVTTPSNGTWHYVYDPLGRRVVKRLVTAGNGDVTPVVEETWFTWEGQRVAEQERVAPDGHVTALTWDYHPGTFTPVAQVRRILTAASDQREIDRQFLAIVTDLTGSPQELVTSEGEMTWQAPTGVWGQVITVPASGTECPLAFPGQYQDEETGLNYNLSRFYDPWTAAYISPDPLGLWGSENPHRYVGNPLAWIDPLGLAAYKIVAENDAGRFGDLNPGKPGDGLEAHHMPQDALGYSTRDDGGAIVISRADHKLTRTYGTKGAITKAAEKGLPFKTVLQRDIDDLRGVGQSQHGDPDYFNSGIAKLLNYYKKTGKLTAGDVKNLIP